MVKLSDIAYFLNAPLFGDGNITITGIASLSKAQYGQITFLSNSKLRKMLNFCNASAVILAKRDAPFCKNAFIVVENPYLAYAKVARLVHITSESTRIISNHALVASDIVLGQRISIGSNTVIESGVLLGDDVTIGSGSFIGKNVCIGDGTCLYEGVIVHNETKIGRYCRIQSHTVLGSDGFGYANDNGNWISIPQLGKLIIGDLVKIGSCTTIDRGALDDTCISNGVIIDNHCHIAHNVVIGKYTAIAGGVIIGGSVTIGNDCMIGGASVINGHIEICDQVTITGMSMVIKTITKSGVYSSGIPAQLNTKWKKMAVLVMNIHKMNERIKFLEQKLL